MIGTLIIIILVILVVRALMKRRELMVKRRTITSALLGGTGEPIGVLFEKNAEEVEIKSSGGIVTTPDSKTIEKEKTTKGDRK